MDRAAENRIKLPHVRITGVARYSLISHLGTQRIIQDSRRNFNRKYGDDLDFFPNTCENCRSWREESADLPLLLLKDVAYAIKSAGEPLHIEPDLDLMVEGFAARGVTVE